MWSSKKGGLLKIVLSVLGIILMLAMFPSVVSGLAGLRATTIDRTDVFAEVETVDPDTTADVILTYALYGDAESSVTSIASDCSTDEPVFDSYESATQTLTVDGLVTDETRVLTVGYEEGLIPYFVAFDIITAIAPTVLFLSFLFGSIWFGYSGIRQYRRK